MTATGDIIMFVLILQGKGDEYHPFDGLDVERGIPAGGMCVREVSNRVQTAVIRVNRALAKVRHQQGRPIPSHRKGNPFIDRVGIRHQYFRVSPQGLTRSGSCTWAAPATSEMRSTCR